MEQMANVLDRRRGKAVFNPTTLMCQQDALFTQMGSEASLTDPGAAIDRLRRACCCS